MASIQNALHCIGVAESTLTQLLESPAPFEARDVGQMRTTLREQRATLMALIKINYPNSIRPNVRALAKIDNLHERIIHSMFTATEELSTAIRTYRGLAAEETSVLGRAVLELAQIGGEFADRCFPGPAGVESEVAACA